MDKKSKGNVAEAKAIAKLTEVGYNVCVPLTENNPYDLVVENEGVFESVQVKSTQQKADSGGYAVDLRITYNNNSRMTHKTYEEDGFDLLFVVTPENFYLIRKENCDGKKGIVVRPENKYGGYIMGGD